MVLLLTKLAYREVTRRRGQVILIVIGLMISTAVITGSLIVGDSMEQLVYISTYENLGEIDQVLQASDFYEYDYFSALMNDQTIQHETDGLVPIILMKCSIEAKDSGFRENKAQIFGFDSYLFQLGNFVDSETGKTIMS